MTQEFNRESKYRRKLVDLVQAGQGFVDSLTPSEIDWLLGTNTKLQPLLDELSLVAAQLANEERAAELGGENE